MLNKFSIKGRLVVLILLPIAILALFISFTLSNLQRLEQGIISLYEDRIVPLQQIKVTSDSYGIAVVDLFHKFRGGQFDATQLQQQITRNLNSGNQAWQSYLNTELTSEEAQLVSVAQQAFRPADVLIERYLSMASDGRLVMLDNAQFNRELYAAFDPLTEALDALIGLQLRVSEQFIATAQAGYKQLLILYFIICSAAVLALGLFGWLIYRSINTPLSAMRIVMAKIAENADVTLRVDKVGTDELAALSDSMNAMLERFQNLLRKLVEAVEQSSSAAEELSAISNQVSQTVQEQEQQLSMVATAITEMSGAIQEVAHNAQDTSGKASDADEQAQNGKARVAENLTAINALAEQVQQASTVIGELNEQSTKITDVLITIQSIAEQTNLLALNAAIESARAGEAGRGFAVVADEVRKLAQSTHEATGSIRDMIDRLQSSAHNAVSQMSTASSQAVNSLNLAKVSGEILERIAHAVETISDMNIQVSTATEQQSAVANELTENINQFSESLSEVAESAQHSAQASEQIAQLAADLRYQVNLFKA